MHKDREPNLFPPFRPIVSSIGTYKPFNASHSKWLLCHWHFYFCAGHSIFNLFIYVSLFTNIPLEECIDWVVHYISEGNPDIKLNKSELRSLFTTATAQNHFIFNGSFYDQIDGVAMGSPLAPVLANLCMGPFEKLWLKNFPGSTILFYRRYVDDTFCLRNSNRDATIFFDYISSRHPNIKFTMEKQVNHKLSFLDVLIDNQDPYSSLTRVYRKKTFNGLLIISASRRTLTKWVSLRYSLIRLTRLITPG